MINAHIDGIHRGVLNGWVYDENMPDQPIEFFLELNDELVGLYSADFYRSDLELAGFGDGKHGFQIELGFNESYSENLTCRLLDSERQPIPNSQWSIPPVESFLKLSQVFVDRFAIRLEFFSAEPHGIKSFYLCSDGNFEHQYHHDIVDGLNQVLLHIPAQLITGSKHFIEISIEGYCGNIWCGNASFNPSYLPLKEIKNAGACAGFIGNHPMAQARYEALSRFLDSDFNDLEREQTNQAHRYLTASTDKTNTSKFISRFSTNPSSTAIVIYRFSEAQDFETTLASLALSVNVNFQIVILDFTASGGGERRFSNVLQLPIVRGDSTNVKQSFSHALTSTTAEVFLFLQAGIELWVDTIEALAKPLQNKHTDARLTTGKMITGHGYVKSAGVVTWSNGHFCSVGQGDSPYKPDYCYKRSVDRVSMELFAFSRNFWSSIEECDEQFTCLSDMLTEMCMSAIDSGKSILFCHNAVGYVDARQGSETGSSHIQSDDLQLRWQHVLEKQPAENEKLHINRERVKAKRILVIDHSSPMLGIDAGSYAAIQEIKILQALGHKVTFLPRNLLNLGVPTVALQDIGVEVLYAPFYPSTEAAIANRISEMNAVYITRYEVAEHFIPLIKKYNKDIPILFNNADFHFLRELRFAEIERKPELVTKAQETKRRELSVMEQADIVLAYTEDECVLIRSLLNDPKKVLKCPWVVEEKLSSATFNQRYGITFLGGFGHLPNVKAVEFFAKEIMPLLLKKRDDLVLYVYGSNVPEGIKSLETDNVVIEGYAEDLFDVYNKHRVFVCPLTFGAGIKGKMIDALAYGTPIVASEIAAEGTGVDHGVNAFIAKNPNDWVNYILECYDNEAIWASVRENGLKLVRESFSQTNARLQFQSILEKVID